MPCGTDGMGQPQLCPCSESPYVYFYQAEVLSQSDYYPFGSLMPGRKYRVRDLYKYGFNGKENDNEVKGEGNQQDYGMRIYDPRLGRFLSVDPITSSYPMLTPYQFASNTPLQATDLDGLEADFSAGKMPVAEYSSNPFTWFGTFWNNVTAKTWNTAVGSAETSVNAFTEKGRQKLFGDASQFYAQSFFWLGGTNNEQKLQDIKQLVSDPHTYESLVSNVLLAKDSNAAFRNMFEMPASAMPRKRFDLARSFYEKEGYSPNRTADHLGGIDYRKSVFETTLKKGTAVEQWQKINETTGELVPGDYYTLPGADPNKLGISLEGTTKSNFDFGRGYEIP